VVKVASAAATNPLRFSIKAWPIYRRRPSCRRAP
jgi:hypothetical protein